MTACISNRAAASIAPGEAQRANPGARHHYDRGRRDHDAGCYHAWRDDDGAAIRPAAAVGAAMEAGAASAGGVRGAKTRERAGNQNCREKRLHVFSLHSGPHRRRRTMIQAVRFGNRRGFATHRSDRERGGRDLNAE